MATSPLIILDTTLDRMLTGIKQYADDYLKLLADALRLHNKGVDKWTDEDRTIAKDYGSLQFLDLMAENVPIEQRVLWVQGHIFELMGIFRKVQIMTLYKDRYREIVELLDHVDALEISYPPWIYGNERFIEESWYLRFAGTLEDVSNQMKVALSDPAYDAGNLYTSLLARSDDLHTEINKSLLGDDPDECDFEEPQ